MAARLRHIALSVSDPEKAAKFFEEAFCMKRVGKAGIGCYVSDGTINVALLKYEDEVPGFHKGYCGLVHFGMWVDDLEAVTTIDAGATYFGGPAGQQPKHLLRSQIQDSGRRHFRLVA
jgi:methylmalonyl-CoA/ethylmalonyl-CoA epimerase